MTLKSDAKFEEKLTCGLENDMRNLVNFHQSTWKCQNWGFDEILLSKSRKCMSLKFAEELCVMTIKNDIKFDDELTCHFKIDMRCLTNFDPSTRKDLLFNWLLWPKYIIYFELKKLQRSYVWHWRFWRKTELCFQKWHE